MRKFTLVLLMILLSATSALVGWNHGFDAGYGMGIADIALGLTNPHDYFVKIGMLREIRKGH